MAGDIFSKEGSLLALETSGAAILLDKSAANVSAGWTLKAIVDRGQYS